MSWQPNQGDDPLAYGDDYAQSRGSGQGGRDRSFLGDTFSKLKTKYGQSGSQNDFGYTSGPQGQQQPQSSSYGQGQTSGYGQGQTSSYGQGQTSSSGGYGYGYGQGQAQSGLGTSDNPPPYPGGPQSSGQGQHKPNVGDKIFGTLHETFHNIGTDVAGLLGTQYQGSSGPGQGQYSGQPQQGQGYQSAYQGPPGVGPEKFRYDSFASEKNGNDVKWYVDGCGYFWAVSLALESARESIWILDWWLSPELYLRRPPSKNEHWRLDRTLQRAAQRGVKVNIIVYKEVTQALTLSSAHTKHALEALNPNIAVFRHPDHLPDAQTTHSSLVSAFEGLKLDAKGLARAGADTLKGAYGLTDDVILYWAHHEKMLLVDGHLAFMGGLDLCFGRWDTNQHSISDARPSDISLTVFPGQDYNNARIMDFEDVAKPFQNKLDRTKSSRMGWSDISVSLHGHCVQDLRHHFIDRWNFIYDEKYNVRKDVRYSRIPDPYIHPSNHPPPQPTKQQVQQHQQQGQNISQPATSYGPAAPAWTVTPSEQPAAQQGQQQPGSSFPPPPGSQPYTQPAWSSSSHPPSPGGLTTTSWQQQPGSQDQAYGRPASASATHTPSAPSPQPWQQSQPTAQGPVYEAGNTSPHLPPPPPGAPPQLWNHSQSQSQTQQWQQPPAQPTAPPSQAQTATQQWQQPQSQPTPPPSHAQAQTTQWQQPQGQVNPTQSYDQAPQPTQWQRTDSYASQTSQSQYSAYHPTAPAPTGSPNPTQQQPYTHQDYQAPAGSHTRGFDDGQAYQGADRGFGYDQNYGGERGDSYSGERGMKGRFNEYRQQGKMLGQDLTSLGNMVSGGLNTKINQYQNRFFGPTDKYGQPLSQARGPMTCQILRSCTKWSNGTATEQSIQNAYIDVIEKSQHFVYIENQFFITATGDKQKPVKNLIGKALVDRILRAARNGEKYKVVVVIPAVPGFAGDLRDDDSLGTRAIMEFQYFSINRGGNSILELIAQAGYNPMEYIRFYNLRNYDRINFGNTMTQVEQQSGVRYEDARKQHDDMVGAGWAPQGEGTGARPGVPGGQYQQYQQAAPGPGSASRWDSVAECYMLGGEDIRRVPWNGPPEAELDAFVSEELYIHTKCLIADDRIAIVGSANLNDRSQLGYHDSEIAILISDPTPVQSTMAGQPWVGGRFASSLRRQLFRKHLGLIRPQNMEQQTHNFEPIGTPNDYDWGTPEDNLVADPLSDTFQAMWNSRARNNTEVFRKAFRAVPDDQVHSWNDYKEFYEYYFHNAETRAEGKDLGRMPPKVQYGHVVRQDFPGGAAELKELLSTVKGTLVEMPLTFLQHEDIAKEGLTLNALTEEIYT